MHDLNIDAHWWNTSITILTVVVCIVIYFILITRLKRAIAHLQITSQCLFKNCTESLLMIVKHVFNFCIMTIYWCLQITLWNPKIDTAIFTNVVLFISLHVVTICFSVIELQTFWTNWMGDEQTRIVHNMLKMTTKRRHHIKLIQPVQIALFGDFV